MYVKKQSLSVLSKLPGNNVYQCRTLPGYTSNVCGICAKIAGIPQSRCLAEALHVRLLTQLLPTGVTNLWPNGNLWSYFIHWGCDWSEVSPATLPCMARYTKRIATRLSHINTICTRATLLQFKSYFLHESRMMSEWMLWLKFKSRVVQSESEWRCKGNIGTNNVRHS